MGKVHDKVGLPGHTLLASVKTGAGSDIESVLVAQLCPTLCSPMDCSPPGCSVHGISQARTLEWVAISFSRDLPDPRIEPRSPAL